MRRLVMLIALSAALGLATTIAVAWSLAAWLPHRGLDWSQGFEPFPAGNTGLPPLGVTSFSRPGMVRRQWFADFAPSLNMDLSASSLPKASGTASDRSWGDLPRSIAAARDEHSPFEDARGWPLLSLWCKLELNGGNVAVHGGLPLSKPGTTIGAFRVLPLRPIPRGLILDSALYGAAWSALLTLVAIRPLRRLRRRARGHCPACGYDLAGLPACPECGWGRA